MLNGLLYVNIMLSAVLVTFHDLESVWLELTISEIV